MIINKVDVKRLMLAQDLATKKHVDQFRANGEPFINHLYRVVLRIVSNYLDKLDCKDFETLVILGWLHDILEDTYISEEYIKKLFGQTILDKLKLLTRDEHERNVTMIIVCGCCCQMINWFYYANVVIY